MVSFQGAVSGNDTAVFASVNSNNGSDLVTVRVNNITEGGFQLAMAEEEKNIDGHTVERVGFVAIQNGDFGEFVTGHHAVSHQPLAVPAVDFAQITQINGADTAVVRRDHINETLYIQEDQSRDSETSHAFDRVSVLNFTNEAGLLVAEQAPGGVDLPIPDEPATLSAAGLYSDIATRALAPGVRPFAPKFALWTDGAEKNRYVYLPPGTQIDNTSEGEWVYPVGTRLYKDFARDGVLLETRLLYKRAEGDWYSMAYVWNATHTDAFPAPEGQNNVLNTTHDVPSQAQCGECHSQMRDQGRAFTAVQLSHEPTTNEPNEVTLDVLREEGLLRVAPPVGGYTIPGTAQDRAALGYLHANCGHCHNSGFVMDVWLDPATLDSGAENDKSVEDVNSYRSLVGQDAAFYGGTTLVAPGNVDESFLYWRANMRGGSVPAGETIPAQFAPFISQMPPLGTEEFDLDGTEALAVWIQSLSADGTTTDTAPPTCTGDFCDPVSGNSCDGLGGCQGGSCCSSIPLSAGTFENGRGATGSDVFLATDGLQNSNSYQFEEPERLVTLTPYALDEYEVTVGRFRNFVAAYAAGWRPAAGDGTGNADGMGWDEAWTAELPASATVLRSDLQCDDEATWTNAAGPNENRPINCVNWYVAEAFCIWDGGRLPTSAEWEFAAAGGMEDRLYPWGSEPKHCEAVSNVSCRSDLPDEVGSFPEGRGRFGHADLAGGVAEWAFDWMAPHTAEAVTDPVELAGGAFGRVLRGSWWSTPHPSRTRANSSFGHWPEEGWRGTGMRCARAVQ